MKIKLYLYHEQWSWEAEPTIVPWHIQVPDQTTGSKLRILLCEHDVEVPDVLPLPEAEIKNIIVTGLRQKAKDLQAETHMKLAKIEEKIQQLLCLTNEVAA